MTSGQLQAILDGVKHELKEVDFSIESYATGWRLIIYTADKYRHVLSVRSFGQNHRFENVDAALNDAIEELRNRKEFDLFSEIN